MEINSQNVEALFQSQIREWPQAQNNYNFLSRVQERIVKVEGVDVKLQYNPARLFSSSAKVDKASIQERPCFLCPDIRPEKQKAINFTTRNGNGYSLLVNPFPIFPKHFTIPSQEHTPQVIDNRFEDMVDIVDAISDYVIFYNGPQCGASAPDHFHFQAGSRGFLPIENHTESIEHIVLSDAKDLKVNIFTQFFKGAVQIVTPSRRLLIETFYKSLRVFKRVKDISAPVPMFNILLKKDGEYYDVLIINRKAHRPQCYYREDETRMLISPGAVDLGGVMVLPIQSDYERITKQDVSEVLRDVCFDDALIEKCIAGSRSFLTRDQRLLEVGIMADTLIRIHFKGAYYHNYYKCADEEVFRFRNGKIDWNGHNYMNLELIPENSLTDSFEVEDVLIGTDFHWQRKQNQRFPGTIKLVIENEQLRLINIVGIEDYLLSVISSEMSAEASVEFLKAHSVISRSWILSLLERKKQQQESVAVSVSKKEPSEECIRWYGYEQHTGFDVCADDHCQRYQGLPDEIPEKLRFIIDDTWGEVLTQDGQICDARFSKCCGGVTERFSTCWEDRDYDYLQPVRDSKDGLSLQDNSVAQLNLSDEAGFEKWVMSAPESFCKIESSGDPILSRIMKHYDQETPDFYRWKVEYTLDELSALVKTKSGIDFGRIQEILPIERGASGRLSKIKIVGSKCTRILGKELEIRKVLSPTHLLSSAFRVVTKDDRVILYGAGWGHGVGLCQIGAAVMGEKGYGYKEILSHYYPGSSLQKIY